MATKVILFIEGESNSPNGDLRQGFISLLKKLLEGKLPRIIMGDGKKQTIDKFLNNRFDAQSLLLVDLDAEEIERENDLNKNGLAKYSESVFYMIQEMEAWFLSQPNILEEFYGKDKNGKNISSKIIKNKAELISNPDEVLQKITKNCNKKATYHKIKHAVELLMLLDAKKLVEEFPDFRNLIEEIRK